MILDNRDNGRVLDALKEAINNGAKLNVITRKLSLYGYSALKEGLDNVDSIQLLLSKREMFPEEFKDFPPLLGQLEDRGLRNELTAQAIAKDFDHWLTEKAEIKGSNDPLNSNHYEIKNQEGDHTVIAGSSTFTSSGLGAIPLSDHEMNTLFSNDESLIVNEAITNCIKHAFKDRERGKIKIELRELGNEVKIKVLDDGIGMPDSFVEKSRSSLGLQLIDVLSQQMDASYNFHSPDNKGTEFSIQFEKSIVKGIGNAYLV